MKAGLLRYAILSLLVTTSLVSRSSGAEPQWLDIRSPNFSIVTNASEKNGRQVAAKFEQMRAAFGALFYKASVRTPVPLQIVAFRNTKAMRGFVPLWRGKPVSVAGLYIGGAEDRQFILLDMSALDPWRIVFHEYAHQLLNGNISGQVQLWFDEGFAEYFSTIEVEGKQARLGFKSPPGHWELLQQKGLMKIADLFRVRRDSPEYNEDDLSSFFYAQSWLVVHYLYDTQQFPNLVKYFDAVLNKNISIEDAIQQSFGISASQFDKILRQYLSANQAKAFTIPLASGVDMTAYTALPMSLAEAKAVLADVHAHSKDYQDKAIDEFQEVLNLQPDNFTALRGLGYAYLRKQDLDRAAGYFRKAAQLNAGDPRTHYYSAQLLSRDENAWLDPETILQVKNEAQACIKLDPDFADAYVLLAWAHSATEEHAQAIASLHKALELNPRNEHYAFNLAQVYLKAQKLDEATAILRTLKNSSDPELAASAAQTMASIQNFRERSAHRGTATQGPAPNKVVDSEQDGGSVDMPRTASAPANVPRVEFLKGKLLKVDCSAPAAATLTVQSGKKIWMMHVADRTRLVLINAESFSCDWTNLNVALNFHPAGENEGRAISLEIQ